MQLNHDAKYVGDNIIVTEIINIKYVGKICPEIL